ncbi:hypothetical protein B7C51_08565 [Paenibacillus larvae subsp. pulvifaciens]|uniref:Uncharacterized protein n=1 Tax=Paenibacillus larvae subsp. pulvifaciens TaxID=1477 RepID=A0A1V0URH2_9BACL|nr:hypothetical protein [Paenibacillus larvae]ARF67873.1 hypothetical protein B7C51_08565 [Paenibacillus larvae subsp. pulvifaciens]
MKVERFAQLPIIVSKDHADYYGCGWTVSVKRKGNKIDLHGERHENDKDVLLSKDECLDIVRSQEFVLLTAKGVKPLLKVLERNEETEEFDYPLNCDDDLLFLLFFKSKFSI